MLWGFESPLAHHLQPAVERLRAVSFRPDGAGAGARYWGACSAGASTGGVVASTGGVVASTGGVPDVPAGTTGAVPSEGTNVGVSAGISTAGTAVGVLASCSWMR